ncbi:hypothetical protein F511_36007 [Dorcoceras hygrometricum]|uniref:Uncharacterized protein n=1 Tax=Dorcoceras hygrometricum TaxID=472368 RepID=A0A2Z7BQ70_9LAMI|nr:hypothetical protein F511_36007 [Dorcoceras hygrometricum]
MTTRCWWLRKARKSWADSDSDSSSSSSSSSDSEQEEVHCFMADQTDDDEVFDFSNVEFTHDDLVIALDDMVKEYRKLSHSFEEAKAENMSLKSSSIDSNSDEFEDIDILNTELSKIQTENEMLKNETSELKAEIEELNQLVSSWNHSSRVLHKLNEYQKQASDKTGVGFNNSEFSEGEISTQSRSAYDKFNKMSFVKADMIYNCLESVKYDNQNSPKLSENGKAGIRFSKPESSKPNWLKNRLDKDKAKASQKPFVPNQSWNNSKKFSLDQRQSSPISTDSSSSLRFDTTDVDATASSLPPVSQDFSAALADLQAILSEQIYESQSGISSRLHKIEQVLRDSLSDQAAKFKNLSQEARQEGRTIYDVQTMLFNEFRKNILAQNASIFVGLADVRKEMEEVNAKVDIMASRLNAVKKDAEATKEALSHQLFEFQSQAQENQNILHAQLSELVDYIHRGSADKKGESGSRGPQQTSNVEIEGSAVRTPTFAQRVEMAQRHIVHTVLDADANRALLERQAAAERDRERRRREARMLKRRRRD